ncbi:hypothetical protein RJ639_033124 [Escallonia herrerae]|uniref:F-box domain-containing protein n=1 Tax=Escallonia herrerae TaxID=1293975 RepID=A0AA88WUT2_9ASTE|nr:hypothetical protein RJ639_033124 [Escallonia herrerae]
MHAAETSMDMDIHMPDRQYAAGAVAWNEDLLVQILLLLPLKSLAKCRCVSNQWRSLINATPKLYRRLYPDPSTATPSALLLCRSPTPVFSETRLLFSELSPLVSVPLNGGNPTPTPNVPDDFHILQSCNGLLCCCRHSPDGWDLYVVNPTTKNFSRLPKNRGCTKKFDYVGVNLAVEEQTNDYSVVGVKQLNKHVNMIDTYYMIEMYSSKTGTWRSPRLGRSTARRSTFYAPPFIQWSRGVYWNGAINWINDLGEESLYFKVDEERLRTMPMPPVPNVDGNLHGKVRYFGKSLDRLHLIEINGLCTRCNRLGRNCHCDFRYEDLTVHELQRDYSGWLVKYRINLSEFPAPLVVSCGQYYYPQFSILFCGFTGEDGDDPELLLRLQALNRVVRYNLNTKTFKNLCDPGLGLNCDEGFGWFDSFQYLETVKPVRG